MHTPPRSKVTNSIRLARAIFGLWIAALITACGGGDPADSGVRALCANCSTSPRPGIQPAGSSAGSDAEGYWTGSGGAYAFATVVLPDGSTFAAYSRSGLIEGVMIGSTTGSSGVLSGALTDYNYARLTVTPASISGSYVAKKTLSAALRVGSLAYSLQATYDPTYDSAVDLSDFAGTWVGTGGSRDGVGAVNFTIGANGTVTGSTLACTFSGTAAPVTASKHPLSVALTFAGTKCPLAGRLVSGVGIATQPGSIHQILVAGTLADRSDGFFGLATR